MRTIRSVLMSIRGLRFAVAGLALAAIGACGDGLGPDESKLLLEVAPARVSCMGLFPTQCYQVRRLPDTNWTLFYDSIRGFDYESGFTYTMSVVAKHIKNPPTDGSSEEYRLLKLIRKERAP